MTTARIEMRLEEMAGLARIEEGAIGLYGSMNWHNLINFICECSAREKHGAGLRLPHTGLHEDGFRDSNADFPELNHSS
jgi:hypothetical protein